MKKITFHEKNVHKICNAKKIMNIVGLVYFITGMQCATSNHAMLHRMASPELTCGRLLDTF